MRPVLPLLLLLGCTKPPYPDAVRMEVPPLEYRVWWTIAQLCSGRVAEGDLGRWTWWTVDATHLVVDGDTNILAYTQREDSLVVLVASDSLIRATIEHEMIHMLGERRHPYDVFVTRCQVENDHSIRFQSGVTEADIPPGHPDPSPGRQ